MFEEAMLKRLIWLGVITDQGMVTSTFAESITVAPIVKLANGLLQAKLPLSSRASDLAFRRCV